MTAARCDIGSASDKSQRLSDDGSLEPRIDEHGAGADEALRLVPGRATRWVQAPGLVLLTSVMEYQSGSRTEYRATPELLTAEELNTLIQDLTVALGVLTGDVFTRFAEIQFEVSAPGATVNVMRPGQIVVGRYRGVRDQLNTIGVGGRFRSSRAIKAGTVFLDEEFDRTSGRRALLRTHELGHALGYDHVESRPSIMNPRIGAEVTEYDRRAAVVAFRESTPVPSCPVL